jgi:hypothetical protein
MSGENFIEMATATNSSQMSRSISRLSSTQIFFRDHDATQLMLPTTRRVVPSTRVCVSAVRARGV